MEVRYYICKHCGNIVEKVKDKGVPVICCGEPMQELKAGVTDAAVEKHVPVYTIEGSHVHVVVGETKHPMLEEHFIEWITLNTNQGIYRKQLKTATEKWSGQYPSAMNRWHDNWDAIEIKNVIANVYIRTKE